MHYLHNLTKIFFAFAIIGMNFGFTQSAQAQFTQFSSGSTSGTGAYFSTDYVNTLPMSSYANSPVYNPYSPTHSSNDAYRAQLQAQLESLLAQLRFLQGVQYSGGNAVTRITSSTNRSGSTYGTNSDQRNAYEKIKDAQDEIDDLEDFIDDVEDDNDASDSEIEDAKDALDDAEDKLDDAEDEYNDGDFRRAIKLADRAEDIAKDAIDELDDAAGTNRSPKRRAEDALDDAEDTIDELVYLIQEAKYRGVRSRYINDAEDELDDAEDKLDDAEDEFDDDDFSQALKLAEDAEEIAEDAIDDLEDEF